MTSDVEQNVLDRLDDAENSQQILDAVGELSNEHKSIESVVIVNAAGLMMANELERGESS